jgi:hypothetical protein
MRKTKTKSSNKKVGGSYPPGSPYTPVPLSHNPYNPRPNPTTAPLAPAPAPAPVVHQPQQQKPNISLHYNIPAYQYLQKPISYYDYDDDRRLSRLFSKLNTTQKTARRTSRKTSRKTTRRISKKTTRRTSKKTTRRTSKKTKGRK